MNLPNSLTLLRIFFVPVLIVILLTRSPNVEFWGFSMHFEVWGVLILLMAAATDWADGYLARRRLQVTTLGIEHRLTREQFLEETCRKAGLPRESWRDPEARLFGFTCEVYSESQLLEGT